MINDFNVNDFVEVCVRHLHSVSYELLAGMYYQHIIGR